MASKLIPCKSCGKEVAKSAKSCPHCGEKLKGSVIGGIFKWILIIFIVLIVIGIFAGGGEDGGVTKTGTGSSAPAPSVKVGETFQTRKFEISITQAGLRNQVGNSFINESPSEGAVFVVVHSSVKNISQKPVSSFSLPRIRLIDPNGTKYDPDVGASAAYATELDLDTKALSDLNPGIKVRDADVFEIGRESFDASTWRILVDADQDAQVSFK